MREYKRERTALAAQVEQLNNRSAYHDEHLRIIDSWFLQVRPYTLVIALPKYTRAKLIPSNSLSTSSPSLHPLLNLSTMVRFG